MRRLSLTARTAGETAATDEIEVALFTIEHADLPAPIRLSSDPTERLSTDPLYYGTRSTWNGANRITDPYLFVIASVEVPSDLEDAPAEGVLVLENVTQDISELLRSFTDRARISMAVVLASSPDLVEVEFRNMQITGASGDVGEVSVSFSRAPIEEESVPMDRFTKDRFPGLFR